MTQLLTDLPATPISQSANGCRIGRRGEIWYRRGSGQVRASLTGFVHVAPVCRPSAKENRSGWFIAHFQNRVFAGPCIAEAPS
jgi:hypothetical protein